MRIRDIEQHFDTLTGDQLLHEIVTFAAKHLDETHNTEEDNLEAIMRAIQARLAAVGIARKHHEAACKFTLGEDRCPCPAASWSWPRKGLSDPSLDGAP